MTFTARDLPDLTDRTVVITGANSGLGLESARMLAGAGATVVMTARRREKHDEAEATIRPTNRRADLRFVRLDLADLSSVRDAAAEIAESHPTVDVLMNNAGVMMSPKATTADGFELQLGTNHLGHFALTGLLLGPLMAGGEGRVVTVSSMVHHNGRMDWSDIEQQQGSYDTTAQYARSKLANLLFAQELHRRIEAADAPLRSVAAHPGYSATNLQSAGVQMSGGGLFHKVADLAMRVGNLVIAQPARQGALPQVHAAVSDVPGGSYWGPDGYREMRGDVGPAHINRKARSTEDAARLWDWSVERTGVDYAALTPATS